MNSKFIQQAPVDYLKSSTTLIRISFHAIPIVATLGLLIVCLLNLMYYSDLSQSISSNKENEENYLSSKKIEEQFIMPFPEQASIRRGKSN